MGEAVVMGWETFDWCKQQYIELKKHQAPGERLTTSDFVVYVAQTKKYHSDIVTKDKDIHEGACVCIWPKVA